MQQKEEVFAKLALVIDPELDQSLPELGFINEVIIEESHVKVSFRLPTYWCSTNFAYMMAEDIRDRVGELPWVKSIIVSLEDHCASAEVNDGVNTGKSFAEAFPDMATGELDGLRRTFRVKAFIVRQEKLLQHFIREGFDHQAILNLTLRDVADHLALKSDKKALAERYFSIREEFGYVNDPESVAFIQPDGQPLDLDGFPDYLLASRRTRLSMEFNGHYCQDLFQTRYHTEPSNPEDSTIESSAVSVSSAAWSETTTSCIR